MNKRQLIALIDLMSGLTVFRNTKVHRNAMKNIESRRPIWFS